MAFNGTWAEYRNENFKEFLEVLGVDVAKLGDFKNFNLELTMKQEGDHFTMIEKSAFRTKETSWTMGQEFQGDLADGSVMKGTYTLETPNCFVGMFTRVSDGKEMVNSREVDGDEMLQTTTFDGVQMKRYFKKEK